MKILDFGDWRIFERHESPELATFFKAFAAKATWAVGNVERLVARVSRAEGNPLLESLYKVLGQLLVRRHAKVIVFVAKSDKQTTLLRFTRLDDLSSFPTLNPSCTTVKK